MNTNFGLINSHMFGAQTTSGEHVDWSEPDIFTADVFTNFLGDVATYAEENPHMIVFEI